MNNCLNVLLNLPFFLSQLFHIICVIFILFVLGFQFCSNQLAVGNDCMYETHKVLCC
uniref:Uncharacterized protein n=1 Tax=Anguilla anguilla TaxID=7936 RepID=A0A0E9WGX9_ANGAN